MPPKKDVGGIESNALLVGFTDKETKLLAAAFVSSTAPDKYDYDIMAKLTGNTAGSLRKMWPPVKKKAFEGHASFAAFLGQAGVAAPAGGDPKPATPAKATKKRKAADEVPKDASAAYRSESDRSDTKQMAPVAKKEKKVPTEKRVPAAKGKGRAKKAVKKEDSVSEEDSVNGGDGLGGEDDDDI